MDDRLLKLISREERDRVMAPIDRAMTLPNAAYASQDWFALETERIFKTRWMGVRFACSIPDPGDAIPFDAFDMPLFAVRGDDRRVRVFHNINPYDGCLVLRAPVKAAESLETLYHGWRHDLRGRLVAAPFWNGTPDCGPEGLEGVDGDLSEIRSETRFGVIFINPDGGAEDIDDWLAPWKETVGPHFAVDDLGPALGRNGEPLIERRRVAANWKTYQENASINVLHEAFTHALYHKSPEVPRVDENGRPTFEQHLKGCCVAFSHRRDESGKTYDPINLPFAGHDPAKQPEVGFFSTVYPNINVPLLDCMIKVNIALPVAPDETELLHLRFYRPEALAHGDFQDEERALQDLFDVIHYEDQLAIEAVQQARRSPAFRQHVYAPFWDGLHHRFNQLVMADLERAPA